VISPPRSSRISHDVSPEGARGAQHRARVCGREAARFGAGAEASSLAAVSAHGDAAAASWIFGVTCRSRGGPFFVATRVSQRVAGDTT